MHYFIATDIEDGGPVIVVKQVLRLDMQVPRLSFIHENKYKFINLNIKCLS